MKNLILLFSHELTVEQKRDALENLKVQNIIRLPDDLQQIWSNIPLKSDGIDIRFKEYINSICEKGDYVLIEGEYGIVYKMVEWALENEYIPIYSYTKREYEKEIMDDGTIKNIHIFKHLGYKAYCK